MGPEPHWRRPRALLPPDTSVSGQLPSHQPSWPPPPSFALPPPVHVCPLQRGPGHLPRMQGGSHFLQEETACRGSQWCLALFSSGTSGCPSVLQPCLPAGPPAGGGDLLPHRGRSWGGPVPASTPRSRSAACRCPAPASRARHCSCPSARWCLLRWNGNKHWQPLQPPCPLQEGLPPLLPPTSGRCGSSGGDQGPGAKRIAPPGHRQGGQSGRSARGLSVQCGGARPGQQSGGQRGELKGGQLRSLPGRSCPLGGGAAQRQFLLAQGGGGCNQLSFCTHTHLP